MAARVAGNGGPYVTLTWPGFSGVIQALAPGRFAAAMNQAPLRFAAGLLPLDWVMARARLWQSPHPTAAHTLRRVFDTAADYGEARELLTMSPIAAPAIFSLAGTCASETCVIERTETQARVHDGPAVAANHWQPEDPGRYAWRGHPRGIDSRGRAALLPSLPASLEPDFSWARWPVLNPQTRLVMVADAHLGRLVAQGFEAGQPATHPLEIAYAA